MVVKQHNSCQKSILAIYDKDVLGKKFPEDEIILGMTQNWYRSKSNGKD